VVTNALSPLGLAITTELASHGAAVIYACTQQSVPTVAFEPLREMLATRFPKTHLVPYPLAVTREDDTLALIDDVLNACGRLDVWVSSSGLLGPMSVEDTGPEELQSVWEENAVAPFLALKHGRRAMEKTCGKGQYPNATEKKGSYGSIIVVGSTASTYGGCWGPCYTMSQHAALGVVKSGVAVLKGSNIRINYIAPGQIDVGVDLKGFDLGGMTASIPPAKLQGEEAQKANIGLERAGLPVEVARVVGFLASGFSSYMTGAELTVDGGAQ
jgi:NAD(P)-dependent dehydrogenase (short-subunit alcohol dehydrogenase family)